MPRRWFRRGGKELDAPTEYLFVDERRLDSYVEEIAGPVAFDAVPTYKASLSLTGPAVEVSRERRARDFTVHEKLGKLLAHLERGGLLEHGRAADPFEDKPTFRLETCVAARALLPPSPGAPPFALWICDPPDAEPPPERREIGLLYLVEDFRGDDFEGAGHVAISGNTALQMLLLEREENTRRPLEESGLGSRSGREADFATRPLELLADLGARVTAPRRIRTLYRVRATFAEEHRDFALVTVGYPIFVAAA